MLFECSWDSGRRSSLYPFQGWLPLRELTAPSKNCGVANRDQSGRPSRRTSLRAPRPSDRGRSEPGRQPEKSRSYNLFFPPGPDQQTDANHDHDAPVNCPLRIAGHGTARQNVDALQEKRSSSQDKQYSSDVQKYFHKTFL